MITKAELIHYLKSEIDNCLFAKINDVADALQEVLKGVNDLEPTLSEVKEICLHSSFCEGCIIYEGTGCLIRDEVPCDFDVNTIHKAIKETK